MHTLEARELTLGYGGAPIVTDLSLELPAGAVTALIGPNGCGKSTLLRGLSRLLRPAGGQVLLGGRDLQDFSARELARRLGLLPQAPITPGGITVGELVALGRAPHQGWFSRSSTEDRRAVEAALEATGTSALRERLVDELSGGQRQRVWIAMALAQDTGVLLLDEPTTFLDLAHALEVLEVIRHLNREKGVTVVMVLHDLNLAARYAQHLVLMADGSVTSAGGAADVLTEAHLASSFGLRARVVADPVTATPMVVPIEPTPVHTEMT
ncbi:ABC transporter ATP-binding protein [Tessaracoccus oleiagri]|uniref:Iron complex transport system ATP-binding protein n=1 Tax=Tessaracoccus oleiagri TaxID=686624 RepID=A0A1G9MAJ4_9ACTN|nr:ABC transporter ATP-binding protein [Tessaracoccus oleiagri]SDL71290.1 iron complex transport system ATP-binding protein [Tessaracoccus oleiagri]